LIFNHLKNHLYISDTYYFMDTSGIEIKNKEPEYTKDTIDLYLTDLLINNELNSLDKILTCYDLEKDPENKQIIEQYIYVYSLGKLNPDNTNSFLNWISNHHFKWWYIIFNKIEINKDNMIEFMQKVLLTFKTTKSNTVYQNIHEIYSIKSCRDLIFKLSINKMSNGKQEEENGIFCWLGKKEWKMGKELCDNIYLAIEPLLSSRQGYKLIIKYIHRVLNYNKIYAQANFEILDQSKCCSLSFLICLYVVLLESCKKYEITQDIFSNTGLRKDFGYDKEDCTELVLALTIFKMHYTIYNTVYVFYNINKENYKYTYDIGSKNRMDMLNTIIKDKEFNENIMAFFNKYLNFDVNINNGIVELYTTMMINRITFTKKYGLDDITCNILINIIDPNEKLYDMCNSKDKIDAVSIIITCFDSTGFKNKYCKLQYLLLRYVNDIKSENILQPPNYHSHLRFCVNMLTKLSSINKYEYNKYVSERSIKERNPELSFVLINSIHKLCSKNRSFLDIILKEDEMIKKNPNDPNNEPNLVKYSLQGMFASVMKSMSITIDGMNNIIVNSIENIDKLEPVLIMPIVNLTISQLVYFSKGNNIIYEIFNMNMEALEIMQGVFKLIDIIKNNEAFRYEIRGSIDILKETVNRVKLTPELKTSINEYIKNFKSTEEDEIPDEKYPNEFIDPLMCMPIKDPVMLPHVNDIFFDKTSIITQLFHNKTNPYTNEPLTIEQLHEFNKDIKIYEKVVEFKNKIDQWKTNYKKQ
jgi:hypothetical protein